MANLVPLTRDYEAELKLLRLTSKPTNESPLTTSSMLGGVEGDNTFGSFEVVSDPLSQMMHQSATSLPITEEQGPEEEDFLPWKARTGKILNKYTTTERESVTCSFIESGPAVSAKDLEPESKAQTRLAQLDTEYQESETKSMMNQQQYVEHLERQRALLVQAWKNDERRKSIIYVIQSLKLLGAGTVSRFYPSKFVIISELLDEFSDLIYRRLKSIHEAYKNDEDKLLEDGIHTEIGVNMTKNWFFKISSVRELLPRLYMEMAFLKSHKFFFKHRETEEQCAMRLAKALRGLGDPMSSTYARAYLVRQCHDIGVLSADLLKMIVQDTLIYTKQFRRPHIVKAIERSKVDFEKYIDLYSPAVEWIMQLYSRSCKSKGLSSALNMYSEHCNNGAYLMWIVESFDPSLIAAGAIKITHLIKQADSNGFPRYRLWTMLCVNLILGTPKPSEVLPILNDVWKSVTKITNIENYITIAEVMVDYPLKYCTPREVEIFLEDVYNHFTDDVDSSEYLQQLHSLLSKVIAYYSSVDSAVDVATAFQINSFLGLLDLFSGKIRYEMYSSIVKSFLRQYDDDPDGKLRDSVVVNAIFHLMKSLHDSLNALSPEDDKKRIQELILKFIKVVDYGRDVEAMLNFYVECRQGFPNIDRVQVFLVHKVAALMSRTCSIVRGSHSNKTADFISACLAFAFITIPAIDNYLARLNLFLLCAQNGYQNGVAAQSDLFIREAITLLSEAPDTLTMKSTDNTEQVLESEPMVVEYICGLLSFLLFVPGHPDNGPLYLLKTLLNSVNNRKWRQYEQGKAAIFAATIPLLCAYSQQKYPYRYNSLDSNDLLYAGDAGFKKAISVMLTTLTGQILKILVGWKAGVEKEGTEEAKQEYVGFSIDLLNHLLINCSFDPATATLAFKVLSQALSFIPNPREHTYLINTLRAMRTLSEAHPDGKYLAILEKVKEKL